MRSSSPAVNAARSWVTSASLGMITVAGLSAGCGPAQLGLDLEHRVGVEEVGDLRRAPLTQELGEQGRVEQRGDPDPDSTTAGGGQPGGGDGDLVEGAQRPFHQRQQLRTVLGDGGAPGGAVEECEAQLLLQSGDTIGQGRLGHAVLTCGRAEGTLPVGRPDMAQALQTESCNHKANLILIPGPAEPASRRRAGARGGVAKRVRHLE